MAPRADGAGAAVVVLVLDLLVVAVTFPSHHRSTSIATSPAKADDRRHAGVEGMVGDVEEAVARTGARRLMAGLARRKRSLTRRWRITGVVLRMLGLWLRIRRLFRMNRSRLRLLLRLLLGMTTWI